MGFPLEMFVHPDQISRALLCSICHELPMEPKQCKSGHVFCRDCIVRWLQQEEVCPMDRSQLRTEELSDCLVVKSLISGLHVRCCNHTVSAEYLHEPQLAATMEFYHEDDHRAIPNEGGANEADGRRTSLAVVEAHVKRRKVIEFAPHTPVAPSNDNTEMQAGCMWTGPFDQLEGHRKQCEYEVASCPHSCGVRLARKVLVQHQQVCTCALISCPDCRGEVMVRQLAEHAGNVCPMRVVQCPSGDACKWRGAQQELQAHLGDSCAAMEVVCSVCGVRLLRSQMAAHLQLSMPEHFQRMIGHMATLQQSVQALQGKTSALELECLSLKLTNSELSQKIKLMTKTRVTELSPEMDNGRKWRVFTFRVPDADRTHYGKYVGFSDMNCMECGRSAVQIGFVVERLRPHEAQMDKLGRWIGVEFEKGHTPIVKGRLWIRFEIFRSGDPARTVSLTHNYNSDNVGLEYDNQRGMLVSEKWGHIWGRSVLLTDMSYANSVGPHGSLFVKYKILFEQQG